MGAPEQSFAADVDRIIEDNLEALRLNLQQQIAAAAGGGDPQVIIDLQNDVSTLQTEMVERVTADALAAGLATKANVAALEDYATETALATLADEVAGKADTSALAGYATDGELTAGLSSKLNAIGALVGVSPTQLFFKVTRNGDATDTSTWSNMVEVWYDPNGAAAPRLVAWFNEYGELRLIPGNSNTVPLRVYAKDLTADPAHTGMLFEVVDKREGTRTTLGGFDSAGNVSAANLQGLNGIKVGGSAPANGSGYLWADTSGV